jgi:hypothetical protein
MGTPRDVVITWPAGKWIDTGFAQCLSQLLLHDSQSSRRVADIVSMISSPRIASTRNSLTEAAVLRGTDWVLMLDADMAFPPDTLDQLLAAADPDERPIVSGLYFGGKPEGIAQAHAYLISETGAFNPIEGTTAPGEFAGLARVHAVGGGCLLVHTDALRSMYAEYHPTGAPWFAESFTAEGHEVGEDITFCLRAHRLGIPIHCLFDLQLGHIKTGVVDNRTLKGYLQQQADGHDEAAVNSDWASRFHFAGGTSLEDAVVEEIVEVLPNSHESLLTLPGLGSNGSR